VNKSSALSIAWLSNEKVVIDSSKVGRYMGQMYSPRTTPSLRTHSWSNAFTADKSINSVFAGGSEQGYSLKDAGVAEDSTRVYSLTDAGLLS
jgi:hypothetical protein